MSIALVYGPRNNRRAFQQAIRKALRDVYEVLPCGLMLREKRQEDVVVRTGDLHPGRECAARGAARNAVIGCGDCDSHPFGLGGRVGRVCRPVDVGGIRPGAVIRDLPLVGILKGRAVLIFGVIPVASRGGQQDAYCGRPADDRRGRVDRGVVNRADSLGKFRARGAEGGEETVDADVDAARARGTPIGAVPGAQGQCGRAVPVRVGHKAQRIAARQQQRAGIAHAADIHPGGAVGRILPLPVGVIRADNGDAQRVAVRVADASARQEGADQAAGVRGGVGVFCQRSQAVDARKQRSVIGSLIFVGAHVDRAIYHARIARQVSIR